MLRHWGKKCFSTTHPTINTLNKKYLEKHGVLSRNILRNLSVPEIYEHGVNRLPADPTTQCSQISSTGALVAFSGLKTGRSPKDKRTVCDDVTKSEINWGDVNIPISPDSYNLVKEIVISYLNHKERLYVVDGYIGWDPKYRYTVRVWCTRAYHALFMNNMLIRPTQEELQKDFSDEVDFHVWNAGEFNSPSRGIPGVNPHTITAVNYRAQEISILGSQYAGEMKKGLFGAMHYFMPKRGVVSLHASANEGEKGDVTLLFGLSGTGKTTLSADPHRKLIGDDEHVWTHEGVFNIEGGCYAKCVNLTEEKEPDIYRAIKFGSVLENVMYSDKRKRIVDYTNISITENTRCSYPLEYIPNVKLPAMGGHPKNIIFLTCDAYGVLPPVSKLTYEQAMYHFMSGYTAKVAGTEVGVKEPQATFSACFGEAFIPFHPSVYAELLGKKILEKNVDCWLINTGWTGGAYGVGNRMSLKMTRAIIDSIHDGTLRNSKSEKLPIFNLDIPVECAGVPKEVLVPIQSWENKGQYNETLKKLADKFNKNFKKYSDKTSDQIKNAGPQL